MTETPPSTQLTEEQQRDISEHKDVAAIAYLWILSVVVLHRFKASPFVQHHARQGVWLFALSIVVWLIPRVGHYLEFFVLAGMIIGFLNAAQGQYHDLPIIGALARGTLTLRDLWKISLAAIIRSVNTVKKGVMGPSQPDPSDLRAGLSERTSVRAGSGLPAAQPSSWGGEREKGNAPPPPPAGASSG